MHSIWLDLRYAARGLRKQPAFAGLAILALALGIGSATTMFSVIQAVLIDPYPMYAHIDRLVQVEIRDPAKPRSGARLYFQTPEFLDYQAQVHSFEDVIGGSFEDVLYTTAQGTEQFDGGLMTPNNFEFMGVRAALGRTFTAEDARPGAPPVFVMNHKMWAGRFGSDPSLIGKTFVLNDVPTTLIGVMPRRFFTLGADLYKRRRARPRRPRAIAPVLPPPGEAQARRHPRAGGSGSLRHRAARGQAPSRQLSEGVPG